MTAQAQTSAIPALARCPNCKGLAFYVEPDGKMIFLHMACDGRALSTDGEYAELSGPDLGLNEHVLSRVYCVSCGWHGAPGELVGCQAPKVTGGRD